MRFIESNGLWTDEAPLDDLPAIHIPDFKLYMVVGSNNQAKVCMAVAEHPYILASYFYVNKGRAVEELKEYVYDPARLDPEGRVLADL